MVEFFSYGCVHCKNFDPQIERWTEGLPEDVRFKRAPVAFSASWGLLAKAYHAAERLGILEANHQRLFSALHDAGLALNTEDAMVQFFDGHGTDGRSFRRALRDPRWRRPSRRMAPWPGATAFALCQRWWSMGAIVSTILPCPGSKFFRWPMP